MDEGICLCHSVLHSVVYFWGWLIVNYVCWVFWGPCSQQRQNHPVFKLTLNKSPLPAPVDQNHKNNRPIEEMKRILRKCCFQSQWVPVKIHDRKVIITACLRAYKHALIWSPHATFPGIAYCFISTWDNQKAAEWRGRPQILDGWHHWPFVTLAWWEAA